MKKQINKTGKQSKPTKKGFKPEVEREQPRKDSRTRRVNFDNARVDRIERDIERDSKKANANDISDFNRNGELLKSAGSVPFATILGQRIRANGNQCVDGAMMITWLPNYGVGDSESIWNKAFQQIYSYIVHANSRNYKYEYTDLAMFEMAGIEIFVAIAEAIRLYGVAKSYAEENLYYGDGLISILGFEPNDIRSNLGQMWFDINNLIMQTRQIWLPDVLPLVQRWIRMNTKLYTDANGKRSQIYGFMREKYYMLSETAATTGTCLVPATYNTNARTDSNPAFAEFYRMLPNGQSFDGAQTIVKYKWAEFVSMIQTMIDQLVMSQDRGMIYGDILKAYGAEKIFAMKEIDVGFVTLPEYNSEVLGQIENVSVCINYNPSGIFQKTADVSNRLYVGQTADILTKVPAYGMPLYQVMNTHIEGQPSPELVMVLSRLKVGSTVVSQGPTATIRTGAFDSNNGKYNSNVIAFSSAPKTYQPSTAGSEICIMPFLYRFVRSSGNVTIELKRLPLIVNPDPDSPSVPNDDINGWLRVMSFDWHPFIARVSTLPESAMQPNTSIFISGAEYGDYDNFISVDDVILKKLNETAFYSLYGVPQI